MLLLTKIIYYLNYLGWSLWDLDVMASLWALNDMASLWALNGIASRMLLLTNIYFSIPPINPFFLRRPTSVLIVLTAASHSMSVLVGGGWCCYHYPLTHLRLRSFPRTVVSHQRDRLFRHCILWLSREPVSLTSNSADCHPAVSVRTGGGHRWELPGNYPVFTVVMVIYHYVERIWRILVTPIFLHNIYDH